MFLRWGRARASLRTHPPLAAAPKGEALGRTLAYYTPGGHQDGPGRCNSFRADLESPKYRKRTAIKKENSVHFSVFSFLIQLERQVIKEKQKLEKKHRKKKSYVFRVTR